MSKIDLKYTSVPADEKKYGKGYSFNSLSKKDFSTFNPLTLGIGDISAEGTYVQALAVFFDLEGFTSFGNQIDPHLVVPEFLNRYLNWLFETLSHSFRESETPEKVLIWGSLPFYAKFLGDGILFLWDTKYSKGFSRIANIVAKLYETTKVYQESFLPEISKHVTKPPQRLRCGIARGQIIALGNGSDYVGSCINIASRLQKLNKLSFAISRRGFDITELQKEVELWNDFVLKKVAIRGIGEKELVFVLKSEFDKLSPSEKLFFLDP